MNFFLLVIRFFYKWLVAWLSVLNFCSRRFEQKVYNVKKDRLLV